MGKEEEKVTITLEEYRSLCKAAMRMEAYDSAGVDNWPGYEYANELLAEWNEQE